MDRSGDARRPETASFIEALRHLERSRSGEKLTPLFTERAELYNQSRREQGEGAAERFWSRYRQQFGDISTAFSRVIESDGAAVLVWTSQGTLANGRPISYDGVSILTFDDGRIADFRTVYDTAAFIPAAATSRQD